MREKEKEDNTQQKAPIIYTLTTHMCTHTHASHMCTHITSLMQLNPDPSNRASKTQTFRRPRPPPRDLGFDTLPEHRRRHAGVRTTKPKPSESRKGLRRDIPVPPHIGNACIRTRIHTTHLCTHSHRTLMQLNAATNQFIVIFIFNGRARSTKPSEQQGLPHQPSGRHVLCRDT